MKKAFLFLNWVLIVGLLLINFTSCNKEEETAQDNLIGTWTISDVTLDTDIGGKTVIQYFVEVLGFSEADAATYSAIFDAALEESFSGTVEIKSDNTYITTIDGNTDTGTWELSSDGKKLTLDGGTADEAIFDVISLTKNLLHINFTETQTEDLNEDTVPETITMEVDMTLTK
ncbi:MAG TPA: lipocalin family protein [Cyclobacteriaceae bacterium]|nr:lipocalin family protein [Cyclobacteriaceae bacterium]